MRPVIPVAAGCLINDRDEVLICQRPPGKIASGKWEFPGGKIEAGESPREALARELREELGIEVMDARPLIRVTHAYTDRTVRLETWRVTRFNGDPHPREQQRMAWVRCADLPRWDLLAADGPIVKALRLPVDYVFTPPDASTQQLVSGLAKIPAGALLRLRSLGLEDRAYEKQAAVLLPLCRQRNVSLMLDRSPEMVTALGAAGWHATVRALRLRASRPVPDHVWFAASCHDAAEIAHATRCGADFAVVGPVCATATHAGADPLGWTSFSELAGQLSRPAYAIGGVGPAQRSQAWQAGGQGVAGIRAYWARQSPG